MIAVSALLDIVFPDDYPNVAPAFSVEPLTGIGNHEAADFALRATDLVQIILEYRSIFNFILKAQENLGMEMIFTITEAIREWLTEYQESVWEVKKEAEVEVPKQKKVEDVLFQVSCFV